MEEVMESTIKCGKHLAEHAKLTGSRFHDVHLGEAEFDDVNLAAAKFENVNLSNARLNNINMSGVEITDVNTSGMKINGILVEGWFELIRTRGTLLRNTFRPVDCKSAFTSVAQCR
jgi:uncharacterized protein YjbI with pentapeptide repeats